jgi:hypothetical protein
LRDWNISQDTYTQGMEKIGISLGEETVSSGGSTSLTRTATLVGIDSNNHGTHVAGIIGGTELGLLPEADLIVDKVCIKNGDCPLTTEGIEDLVINGHADVVNASLGSTTESSDGFGVEETLINRLTSMYNVLFFAAAGNEGPNRQTVDTPSTARLALSIAAMATPEMIQTQYQYPAPFGYDFIYYFSSRGPSITGGFKPNLSAPGSALSSVPLVSLDHSREGMDILWGTSMATPMAAGAYALLLDGIHKYNQTHPHHQGLTTDALVLREVLLQTARPFDISRLDTTTGDYYKGNYTWVDEGMGTIDLVAAWKKVFELRDASPVPTSVNLKELPVELDYEGIVPQWNEEDSTRPILGAGIYLDYYDTETLKRVAIARRLPEKYLNNDSINDLSTQLKTTQDRFELKTWIYGSDKNWLKVGTLDQLDCASSPTSDLTVVGDGVSIEDQEGNSARVTPFKESSLNICINRRMVQQLRPGDHGALIMGYRKQNGRSALLPSFTIPVYLVIPHYELANENDYIRSSEVSSFGLNRHLIYVPENSEVLRLSLQAPVILTDEYGLPAAGEHCSAVELMLSSGAGFGRSVSLMPQSKVTNCDSEGRVLNGDESRLLTWETPFPTAGIWDISVIGEFQNITSKYRLEVGTSQGISDKPFFPK